MIASGKCLVPNQHQATAWANDNVQNIVIALTRWVDGTPTTEVTPVTIW